VSYLRGLGIDLNRVAHASDNAIIQAMVAAGRGVALLTELSIDESDPDTATVRLGDWIPTRRVGLGWHPEQASSPALEAFIGAAREVTRRRRERIRSAA
jgi:DNA-binding transcriptional LysR family regulator